MTRQGKRNRWLRQKSRQARLWPANPAGQPPGMKRQEKAPAIAPASTTSEEKPVHTFTGNSCVIHHNGDFQGPITVAPVVDGTVGEPITIDVGDLLDFVAEAVRSSAVEDIEQASTGMLLGLPEEGDDNGEGEPTT